MSEERDNQVRDSFLRLVQPTMMAVLTTGFLATGAWAWNAEHRISETERYDSRLASLEKQSDLLQQNTTQIEVLKTELSYIKQGINDIKTLLSEKTRP